MTIPRLVIIAIACLAFFDMKYGNGRLVDTVCDEAASLGYWINNEIQGLTYRIARVH